MAIITKTIGIGGSHDYSSLAAWEAAFGGSASADLVANGDSIIGQCFFNGSGDGEFVSASTLLTISGFTTDASHTITLTTGTGQSFRDNANAQINALAYNASNGVGIRMTGNYNSPIHISSTNVFLSNLQISGAHGALFTDSSAPTLDDCICECLQATPSVRIAGGLIRNSLVIARSSGSIGIYGFVGGTVINCTIVSPSDITSSAAGIQFNYATGTVENTAVFGFAAVVNGSSTNTTCMTDVVSPPTGFTGGKTYANQFQNTLDATRDFRAKAGADLLDAGTTDITNALHDIVGTLRPQGTAYDIGAWELVVSAAFIFVPPSFADGPRRPDRMIGY